MMLGESELVQAANEGRPAVPRGQERRDAAVEPFDRLGVGRELLAYSGVQLGERQLGDKRIVVHERLQRQEHVARRDLDVGQFPLAVICTEGSYRRTAALRSGKGARAAEGDEVHFGGRARGKFGLEPLAERHIVWGLRPQRLREGILGAVALRGQRAARRCRRSLRRQERLEEGHGRGGAPSGRAPQYHRGTRGVLRRVSHGESHAASAAALRLRLRKKALRLRGAQGA